MDEKQEIERLIKTAEFLSQKYNNLESKHKQLQYEHDKLKERNNNLIYLLGMCIVTMVWMLVFILR
jgi:archaellum component FlaC